MKFVLEQIISGGQTGADQAALRIAKQLGFKTGGFLPAGCITLDGPRRGMIHEYGMVECSTRRGYAYRTKRNVRYSDGTLRFASDFSSSGEICTLRAILDLKKPYFDISFHSPCEIEYVLSWLVRFKIRVLNVAGNSEKICPGIGAFVEYYLGRILRTIKGERRGK